MNRSLRTFFAICILAVLVACTPMIYGVPQDRWDLMSEQERIAAMEAYKQRQIAYQQAAAERARIRAEQEARRQAQLEEEMRQRQERVDLIYRGRSGTFGDLLEITLYDGQMRLNYQERGYFPVTFKIADGEIKSVPIHYSKGRQETLYVLYENRHLWLDTDPYGQNTRRSAHLAYNNDWAGGVTYNGINSHGQLDMRRVSVDIDVVPIRHGRGFGNRQPTVIIKEKIVERPPRVIVKERIVQAPPEIIVREKLVPAQPKVIIQEESENDDHADDDRKHHRHGDSVEQNHADANESGKDASTRQEREKQKRADQEKRGGSPARIHVELNGGTITVNGRHRPFRPVNFWISEGETKKIKIAEKSLKKSMLKNRTTTAEDLVVTLKNGQLVFNNNPGTALNVANRSSGKLDTKELSGIDVKISVHE